MTGDAPADSQPQSDAGTIADAGIDDGGLAATDAGTGDPVTVNDGGIVSDAGTVACSGTAPQVDAGVTYSPGPVPAADQQSVSWMPTGALGCDGLVPTRVPPRLSWTAPVQRCFDGDPTVSGSGDLAFAYDEIGPPYPLHLVFFPSNGTAGLVVSSAQTTGFKQIVGVRPRGFFTATGSYSPDQGAESWVSGTGPDGSDQGVVACFAGAIPGRVPDPRGGYVESRIRVDYGSSRIVWNLELRWVDGDLIARTPWWWLTSWDYDYNVYPQIHVDVNGNALVLLYFNPPMSMPCNGDMTWAAWVSATGSVSEFTPVKPSLPNDCGGRNLFGFGSAVTLDEGGFAFFVEPFRNLSPTGWYAYASGSGTGAVPAWLQSRDAPVQRLASGAYLGTRRDPATCARTAEILGPAGQVCATLPLDGSDGCDDADRMSPDGTLALYHAGSCSLRWRPKLGSP